MMTDVAQIAALAGTLAGSAAAAFISKLALTRSKGAEKSSEKVRTEMLGEGTEPSLRQILLDNRSVLDGHIATVAGEFAKMHADSRAVVDRIDKLEKAVFTSIESRVAKLEFIMLAPATKARLTKR